MDSTIQDDLGEPASNATWRMFRYAGTGLANYEEADEFILGESYWLKQVIGNDMSFDLGAGKSITLDGHSITLQPRSWHFISSPYTFPVQINVDTLVFYGPFTYGEFGTQGQEGWSTPTAQVTMQPWGGYVLYNNTDAEQVFDIVPPTSSQLLAKSVSGPTEGWRLQLVAEGTRFVDAGNYIGRLKGASEGQDAYDHPDMPRMEDYLSLSIERPDSNPGNGLSSDIRSLEVFDGVWPLSITSRGDPGSIKIIPHLVGNLPADMQVVLLDLIAREAHDFTNATSPATISRRNERFPHRLKAIAGSPAFVKHTTDQILAALPAEFALAQNYPNPFNPATTIEYALPRPAHATLAVYDLLGREVIILYQGWQDMGYHEVVWNGRDRRGVTLASGIYFAVFQAEKTVRTRKLVLLK